MQTNTITSRFRPYHAGSVLGLAPEQSRSAAWLEQWANRCKAYYPRGKSSLFAKGLLSFIGADGRLMPSFSSLAKVMKCCERTARRCVAAFEAAGFLRKIPRRNLFGQTSNGYLLLLPGAPPTAPPAPAQQPFSKMSFYNQPQDLTAGASTDILPQPARVSRQVPARTVSDRDLLAGYEALAAQGFRPAMSRAAQLRAKIAGFIPKLE